jgi:hypothetical protein
MAQKRSVTPVARIRPPAQVLFLPARVFRFRYEASLEGRLVAALAKVPFDTLFGKGALTAVKMHLGNPGAHRTIRPQFVRAVVDRLRAAGLRPFVTDSVRMKGYEYLETANRAGYNEQALGAPVIIADGLFGSDTVEVAADEPLGKMAIPSAIHEAPAMVVLSHVKGHIQAVYAGALKNLAMGCVSAKPRCGTWREGRGKMHFLSSTLMTWTDAKCTRCLDCQAVCPQEAIAFTGRRYAVDEVACFRCGRCARVCPTGALTVPGESSAFLDSLAVAAKAVIATFEPGRVWYANFVLEVQPECDCMPMADTPLVQDQGILLSDDPVAVDAASWDLITGATPLPDSAADGVVVRPGSDLLSAVHAKDGRRILATAERLGLGTASYELKVVGQRKAK